MVDKDYLASVRVRLEGHFPGADICLEDQSDHHAGHAGHDPRGGSHLHVRIAHASLEPLSRVERHRRVYEALKDEWAGRLHALSVEILPNP